MKHMLLPFLALCLTACQTEPSTTTNEVPTPPQEVVVPNTAAPGFDLDGSDDKAISIADAVVEAHGGRAAWDKVRYLKFNFFGARELLWDRYQQRVRISMNNDSTILLYDDSTGEGRARIDAVEVTESEELATALRTAKGMMINDTYWLIQPFKLKDSGTTLTYVREEEDIFKSRACHVLQLDFNEVGNTPDNRYRILVDKETNRINSWQFFSTAEDPEPAIETPYNNYQEIAGVLFSEDRRTDTSDESSRRYRLGPIEVLESVDEALFTDF